VIINIKMNTKIITMSHCVAEHLCETLHDASRDGHNECIKTLLAHGAPINEKDNCGYTPLHYASRNGHNECIKTLLVHGALINEKDNNGCTPLSIASRDGHDDCIKTLLAHGAPINKKITLEVPLFIMHQEMDIMNVSKHC
jgi:ankyrin repeat protein